MIVLPFRGYGTLTPLKIQFKSVKLYGVIDLDHFSTISALVVFFIKITKNVRKKILLKADDFFFLNSGLTFDPNYLIT